MYKVLVIASTEHVLQFKSEFEKSGLSFDFCIEKKDSTYNFGSLESQFLNIEHELVPFSKSTEVKDLTASQLQKRNSVAAQMNQLRLILFQSLKLAKKNQSSLKVITATSKNDPAKVIYLDEVIDLKMNQKDKKIHLEIQHSGVRSYDHVLIEESYLNLSTLSEKFKQQDLFKTDTQQVFQFVGQKFKVNEDLGSYKFWSMTDTHYNSIYDNLYYINVQNNIMDVWLWLPAQQLKNSATRDYFIERAQKHLSKKFDFLKLEVMPDLLDLQPINTYMESANNYKNQITFLPHFHFCSLDQTTNEINQISDIIIKKLIIKKEFIQTQPIEDSL